MYDGAEPIETNLLAPKWDASLERPDEQVEDLLIEAWRRTPRHADSDED